MNMLTQECYTLNKNWMEIKQRCSYEISNVEAENEAN